LGGAKKKHEGSLAASYKALGDLPRAISNFEEYTKKEKRASEQTWVEVARKEIDRLRGEAAKAQEQAAPARAKASTRAPRAPVPHYKVGLTQLRLGNFAWAIEAFRRALTIGPNYQAARCRSDAAAVMHS